MFNAKPKIRADTDNADFNAHTQNDRNRISIEYEDHEDKISNWRSENP